MKSLRNLQPEKAQRPGFPNLGLAINGAQERIQFLFRKDSTRRLLRWSLWMLIILHGFGSLFYLKTEIFHFPEPAPFQGSQWFNPYEGTENSRWLKANFHGHSQAWGGLTNGSRKGKEYIRAYQAMGYEVPVITNYHGIDPAMIEAAPVYIPSYEHGYNLEKSHRLCLGADQVLDCDFPLGHLSSHEQYLLHELRPHTQVIALAHPSLHNGHSLKDCRRLTGYDCLEVFNHFRTSEKQWDAALSAGIPAWQISNDDTHDSNDPGETGVCWNMLASHQEEPGAEDILTSLKTGKSYGVKGKQGMMDNRLESIRLNGDTLRIRLEHAALAVEFVADNGKVRDVHRYTKEAWYLLKPEDHYVRIRVENVATRFVFNPVIRTPNGLRPENHSRASLDFWGTLAFRFLIAMEYSLVLFLAFRRSPGWWFLKGNLSTGKTHPKPA